MIQCKSFFGVQKKVEKGTLGSSRLMMDIKLFFVKAHNNKNGQENKNECFKVALTRRAFSC